tara:strand:- start:416 stop:781 length:366 start_codon:yes stop_codon:yes gene_type:complete
MKEIFKLCEQKMKQGEKQYGEFNPAKEKRWLIDEAKDEIIDLINYSTMLYQQFDHFQEKYGKEEQLMVENCKLHNDLDKWKDKYRKLEEQNTNGLNLGKYMKGMKNDKSNKRGRITFKFWK